MHVLHVLPSVMCESGRFQSLLVSRRYSTEMVYMKKILMPKRLPRLVVDHSFLLQSQFSRQTFELFVSKRGWWCYFIRKNFRRWNSYSICLDLFYPLSQCLHFLKSTVTMFISRYPSRRIRPGGRFPMQ